MDLRLALFFAQAHLESNCLQYYIKLPYPALKYAIVGYLVGPWYKVSGTLVKLIQTLAGLSLTYGTC